MLKKILVPTDGLLHSRKAVEFAAGLARLSNAELIGVHAVPTSTVSIFRDISRRGGTAHDYESEYRRDGESYLRTVERDCASQGVRVRTFLLEGFPPEEILKLAERENVDLIVLGSRRRSSVERWLTGRTSDEVIRNSKCPVAIVTTPW